MKIYTEQTKKNILIFNAIQMQKFFSKEIANFSSCIFIKYVVSCRCNIAGALRLLVIFCLISLTKINIAPRANLNEIIGN